MTRRLIILLFVLTLGVMSRAQDTVQYADTFRLQQVSAVDTDDDYLLNLLVDQGASIHLRDSLRHDSLLLALQTRDSVLRQALQMVQDSMYQLQKDQIRRRQIQDSLRHLAHLNDSISRIVVPHLSSIRTGRWQDKTVQQRMTALSSQFTNRPRPWKIQASALVHATQNYVSKNWYQGGVSSVAIFNQLKGEATYKCDKISWTNTGEWRFGWSTVAGDSLRKINTTDDVLKLYSKFGYQFFTNLYLSSSAEFQTQLFNSWKENEYMLKTSTFSPIRFTWSFGVDYQPVKDLSIVVSPLTYKMVYSMLGDDSQRISVASFGITPGEHILNDFGSSVRVNYTWRPIREISLSTQFYFYTNYHRVELDWEVDAHFIINRFLTARIELHPRYDNTIILTGKEKAIPQFKELISFGFAHKFSYK